MTLTKNQVDQLIERLSDKTLSFGCLISNNHQPDDNPYKVRTFIGKSTFRGELVYKCIAYDGKSSELPPDALTVLGHPILIGDVLEKLRLKDQLIVDYEDARRRLPLFWESCSFTSSLQEIYNRLEWKLDEYYSETQNQGKCVTEKERDAYRLAKPSPETNLFIFLKEIGL